MPSKVSGTLRLYGIEEILSGNLAVGYLLLIKFVAKEKKKLWPRLRRSIFSWLRYRATVSLEEDAYYLRCEISKVPPDYQSLSL